MADSWLRLLEGLTRSPAFDANEMWCNHAIKTIQDQFGDVISVDLKRKSLLKFGMNNSLVQNSESHIAQLPDGISQTADLNDNLIDTISSSDASFTGDVYIEGHKIVDGLLIFVTQTITLNGQNKVLLDTPLIFPTRAENADETLFTSLDDLVYIYEDGAITGGVPDDPTLLHLSFQAIHRQSLRAATAFSFEDYGLITQIYGDLNKDSPPNATANIIMRVRQLGEGKGRRPAGFKTKMVRSVSSTATNTITIDLRPFFIVPKNSIITMNAETSASGASLSAGFNTILAKVAEQ